MNPAQTKPVDSALGRCLFSLGRLCAIACIVLFSSSGAFSSGSAAKAQERSVEISNTITGKVIADDGQPTDYATVFLMKRAGPGTGDLRATADENGEFIFRGLAPGSYYAQAGHPGYVSVESVNCQPGENVTLHTIKGGVITGRVTDADGNPMIGLIVSLVFVRNSQGKLAWNLGIGFESQTDDRGIYRAYGLSPGSYVIRASGKSEMGFRLNPYLSSPPTYYPSGGRNTAKEIVVLSGSETSGIDISFRGEPGHSISGKVSSANIAGSGETSIYLTAAGSPVLEDSANMRNDAGDGSFALAGIGDGDYEIIAVFRRDNRREVVSRVQRITMKGHDITGLRFSPSSGGSVSGRVVMETGTETLSPGKCVKGSPQPLVEVSLIGRNDDKIPSALEAAFGSAFQMTPSESGSFAQEDIYPGNYRLEWFLPGDDLYVKSITRPGGGAVSGSKPDSNPLSGEIAIKAGEKTQPISITLGRGAATLSGSVRPEKSNNALPDLLRVYLVPIETEAANDIWRYYETKVDDEGKFTIRNIMPGRYRMIARRAYKIDGDDLVLGRLPWNANLRTALHKEAEEKGKEIELKPCSKSTDAIVTVREQ